jgi:3-hydroxyacyl-[acyl-carrier-protein] dehydratase
MVNATGTRAGLPAHASPLAGVLRIRHRSPDGLTATYLVDADEPVLSGHFPGFAIFPGVCLLECAHQAALHALPAGATLAAVERVRFRAPVLPGDEVTVRLAVDGWTCTAKVAAQRVGGGSEREAAVVRLRYREGAAGGPG